MVQLHPGLFQRFSQLVLAEQRSARLVVNQEITGSNPVGGASIEKGFRRTVPKLKSDRGYRFIKELGGAIRRSTISFGADWLVNQNLVNGRVLDYGCGFGFDADQFGWERFDPYYHQTKLEGDYDTIICNHVLNMLTRASRERAMQNIRSLLTDAGVAWLIVPRNIPQTGKAALRKRIQNYVVLTLHSVYADEKREIYRMTNTSEFEDTTNEIERRLNRN